MFTHPRALRESIVYMLLKSLASQVKGELYGYSVLRSLSSLNYNLDTSQRSRCTTPRKPRFTMLGLACKFAALNFIVSTAVTTEWIRCDVTRSATSYAHPSSLNPSILNPPHPPSPPPSSSTPTISRFSTVVYS